MTYHVRDRLCQKWIFGRLFRADQSVWVSAVGIEGGHSSQIHRPSFIFSTGGFLRWRKSTPSQELRKNNTKSFRSLNHSWRREIFVDWKGKIQERPRLHYWRQVETPPCIYEQSATAKTKKYVETRCDRIRRQKLGSLAPIWTQTLTQKHSVNWASRPFADRSEAAKTETPKEN